MASLLPHQPKHVEALDHILSTRGRALDLSDTGTGKTYTACGLAQRWACVLWVVAPKSTFRTWLAVALKFGIQILGLSNYESMKNGKVSDRGHSTKRISSRYFSSTTENKVKKYTWNLPKNCLVVFDEVHCCKNPTTGNAGLLNSLLEVPNPLLMMSATMFDKPQGFEMFGKMLKMYDPIDSRIWIKELKGTSVEQMQFIHAKIFPKHAVRMKKEELELSANHQYLVNLTPQDKIQKELIKYFQRSIDYCHKKEDSYTSVLPKLTYARQRLEMEKLPTIIRMAEEDLKKGDSVIIFLNFNEAISRLAQYFKTAMVITGEVPGAHRNDRIHRFQRNLEKLIICNIAAGGVGISLHDVTGRHPRKVYISPTWVGTQYMQALGRAHRADTKSEVVQRIFFFEGEKNEYCEQLIRKNIGGKVENMACLNDGLITKMFQFEEVSIPAQTREEDDPMYQIDPPEEMSGLALLV